MKLPVLTSRSPGYREFMDSAFNAVARVEPSAVEIPGDIYWAFGRVAADRGVHLHYGTIRKYLISRGFPIHRIAELGPRRYCVGVVLRDQFANPN